MVLLPTGVERFETFLLKNFLIVGWDVDPWPPYSPDMTFMDFFLWGYIKSQVYTTAVTDMEQLKARITQTFHNLPMEMVRRSIHSYDHRLRVCVERGGAHVEKRY